MLLSQDETRRLRGTPVRSPPGQRGADGVNGARAKPQMRPLPREGSDIEDGGAEADEGPEADHSERRPNPEGPHRPGNGLTAPCALCRTARLFFTKTQPDYYDLWEFPERLREESNRLTQACEELHRT